MKRALVVTAFAMLAMNLPASTIYSNFGPADTFQAGIGAVVVSGGIDQRPSFGFTSSVDQPLTEIDFVTSVDPSNTSNNSVTITLSADNGGVPGIVIASQTFTNSMGIRGSLETPPTILSWLPSQAPSLLAQTKYWVTFDAPGAPAQGDVFWNYNSAQAFGYSTFTNGTWSSTSNTLGAIRILSGEASVNPAPEPGTILLLGCGLGALAAAGRTRHFRS